MNIGNPQVTFAQLFSPDLMSVSSGVITVTSAGTLLTTLDLGNRTIDDRLWIAAAQAITKGVTPGMTWLEISKLSGTAQILWFGSLVLVPDERFQPASTAMTQTMFAVLKVLSGGTLTMRAVGYSFGSNGTVGDQGAQLQAMIMHGR